MLLHPLLKHAGSLVLTAGLCLPIHAQELPDFSAAWRTDFLTLFPGIYTDHERDAVLAYLAENAAIRDRGPVDIAALIAGELPPETPGIGLVIDANEDMVRYQNAKYDPENPIRNDSAYAQSIGYQDILAYPTFAAHDDSVMIPWPPAVRDKLLVSDLNHSVTAYAPIYPGDTLYTVVNSRDVVDLTPTEGSTYRAVAIESQASIYNQSGVKVNDVTFRVTEQLSVYADASMRMENPGFFDIWEAPDWMERPARVYSDDDWIWMRGVWEAEDIRGGEPRYWEDVAIGDRPVPTLEGPVIEGPTPTWGLGQGAGGSVNIKPWVLAEAAYGGLIRNPVDGIYRPAEPSDQIPAVPALQVYNDAPDAPPAPAAIDTAIIHSSDIGRGPLTNFTGRDFAIRHLTNWMGDAGEIRNISWSIMDPRSHWALGMPAMPNPNAVRYLNRIPGMEGRFVTAHGLQRDAAYIQSEVVAKRVENSQFVVDIVWWIETIEGDIWQEGLATIELPSSRIQ